jgi:hypothetical protein
VTSFAEFFGLADETRTTFVLSPERDPGLLVDVDGLIRFLDEKARPGATAPQAVLFGEFGTGKTHALRYVEHVLAPKHGLLPIYLPLSNFGPKSTFADVHVRVMNALDEPLQAMLQAFSTADQAIMANSRLNRDAKEALARLRNPSTPPKERATVRTWLMGVGPTPTQARSLGFAGRLFETAGPVELVNLWKGIGEIWAAARGKRLVLLLDEGEAFGRVTDSRAQASLGAGFRELFDTDNAAIGVFLAVYTPDARKGIHPLSRAEFESRIAEKRRDLRGLSDPDHVRRFVQGWWELIGRPGTRLLDEGALDLIASRLKDLRDVIAVRPQPALRPTQRNLMDVLAFIGKRAVEDGRRPPLTERDVRTWFALRT